MEITETSNRIFIYFPKTLKYRWNWNQNLKNWVKKLKIDHKNDMQTDFDSEISFIFWKEKKRKLLKNKNSVHIGMRGKWWNEAAKFCDVDY